jgi:hypothetical protein
MVHFNRFSKNTVTYFGCVTYRRGMDWILDLLTPLWTTRNYSAITDLHTLQLSLFPACCVVTSHSLATALTVEILQLPVIRSSCHSRPCRTLVYSLSTDNDQLRNSQSNSLLQLPTLSLSVFSIIFAELNSRLKILRWLSQLLSAGLGSSLYSLGADSTENTVSIVIAQQYLECCLRIRCHG